MKKKSEEIVSECFLLSPDGEMILFVHNIAKGTKKDEDDIYTIASPYDLYGVKENTHDRFDFLVAEEIDRWFSDWEVLK